MQMESSPSLVSYFLTVQNIMIIITTYYAYFISFWLTHGSNWKPQNYQSKKSKKSENEWVFNVPLTTFY